MPKMPAFSKKRGLATIQAENTVNQQFIDILDIYTPDVDYDKPLQEPIVHAVLEQPKAANPEDIPLFDLSKTKVEPNEPS